jgi:hypothetical protein
LHFRQSSPPPDAVGAVDALGHDAFEAGVDAARNAAPASPTPCEL